MCKNTTPARDGTNFFSYSVKFVLHIFTVILEIFVSD